jgi:hypothetical protein
LRLRVVFWRSVIYARAFEGRRNNISIAACSILAHVKAAKTLQPLIQGSLVSKLLVQGQYVSLRCSPSLTPDQATNSINNKSDRPHMMWSCLRLPPSPFSSAYEHQPTSESPHPHPSSSLSLQPTGVVVKKLVRQDPETFLLVGLSCPSCFFLGHRRVSGCETEALNAIPDSKLIVSAEVVPSRSKSS